MTFESSILRLEEIVKQIDDGRTDLETALSRYEEGVSLLRRSHEILDTARRRIEILRSSEVDGSSNFELVSESAFKTAPVVCSQEITEARIRGGN